MSYEHKARLSAETESPHANSFEQNMERLLTLADEADDTTYAKIEWSDDETAVLQVSTISLVATGARRQENRGRFNQAQFKVTENTDDDIPVKYFLWLQTGFQKPGTPISPDGDRVAEDHGYHKLTHAHVVYDLAKHAESTEDILSLLQEMKVREVASFPELVPIISRHIYDMVYGRSGVDEPDIDQEAIFNFFNSLQGIGYDGLTRQIQGNLLSKLLRAVAGYYKGSKDANAHELYRDKAASVIEMTTRKGIIPKTPYFMQRVCSNVVLYKYPFATHLLHDQLLRSDVERQKNVFGMDRISFTNNYILMVLTGLMNGDNGDNASRQRVHNLLTSSSLSITQKDNSFYKILSAAGVGASGTADGGKDMTIKTITPQDIRDSFSELLQALSSNNPQDTAIRAEFNKKCLEIVDILLRKPRINQELGERATRSFEEA